MVQRRVPPSPINRDIRAWAIQLVEYLQGQTGDENENTPRMLLLPHQVVGRPASAVAPGALMYDPVSKAPIFSNGTAWNKLSSVPVSLAHPASDAMVAVNAAAIADPLLRTIALALQEVIARLDEVERT